MKLEKKDKKNKVDEISKDLSRELKNLLLFLEKNNKLIFLITGWIFIFFGSVELLKSLLNIKNNLSIVFNSANYLQYLVSLIFKLISLFFVIYSGFNMIKYKKITLSTLMIYFFFHTLWILFSRYSNFAVNFINSLLWFSLIFWWVSHNKKIFIN